MSVSNKPIIGHYKFLSINEVYRIVAFYACQSDYYNVYKPSPMKVGKMFTFHKSKMFSVDNYMFF